MNGAMSHDASNIIVSFVRFDLPLSRAQRRSLARLLALKRTRGHGVRWLWQWRRLMTRVMTRVIKRARDRQNCARRVTACVVHHFHIFLPAHTLVAAVARLSSLSRARSRGARWGGGCGGSSAD